MEKRGFHHWTWLIVLLLDGLLMLYGGAQPSLVECYLHPFDGIIVNSTLAHPISVPAAAAAN